MTDNTCRLAAGGRINRDKPVAFVFNGRQYQGFEGDTLASALLANDVRLVARSFKYHRPRGIFSAGVEEPNALVQTGHGGSSDANVPMTMCEIHDGLTARSQNCWPSVNFDVMAANNLFSPLLVSGFYYKTFIGLGRGTGAWMFFEKFIRRAAGMGAASKQPDPDRYEKVNAHCDVLIIGAGPAGLEAAGAAARDGARIILVEQDSLLGGSLLRERDTDQRRTALVDQLQTQDNVRILTRTTAFGAYDGSVFGLVERVTDHLAQAPAHIVRQRYWVVRARKAILATGAIERPIVFGGNDLPGVMLAAAARTYVNRYAVLPGRRVVVFTNNDSAYLTARDTALAGASVVMVDARPEAPADLARALADAGVEIINGHGVLKARGGRHVSAAAIGPVDQAGRVATVDRSLPCDCLCVSGGWSPTIHLWSQIGGKLTYDADACAFTPVGALKQLECVGAAAGMPAAQRRGGDAYCPGNLAAIWQITHADETCAGKAFVDLQHDITDTDVKLACREGYRSVEHLKRYTTQGMATDQGKTANVNAIGLLALARGIGLDQAGTTTFRPPYTPVATGVIAAHEHGRHLRPTRLTPVQDWHQAHGTVSIEAGLWMRPCYYPKTGETERQACIREAAHVRAHVGIVDISTLGKIAVQGPDAGEFLNRVYVNNFKTLAVGRIRYGVMLRDDGFVFDDGTTARLGENDYFTTTTTANAASVLSQMEFMLQTTWRHLTVHVTSVTEQWAAIAVAGPRSRALLQAACTDIDVSNAALPHMHFAETAIDGAPIRLCRMSYSGELAYEVYTPAGYGAHVWGCLMKTGRRFGVMPYGTEAMGTLRIEKGHIA
ncbi:MAG: 2Fe-2S iron-sulfur cluster-binding protein, partial [Gammaproteobacteria bacterium]|nr:2Fe-2S iron-sulfur cluster-binding protein [Gammaproteobacteria bacterium]